MAKRHSSREAICLHCGATFQSYTNGKSPTGWTECCSRKCGMTIAARRRYMRLGTYRMLDPVVVRTYHWHCSHCSKAYHIGTAQQSRYCSYECFKASVRTEHEPRPCRHCGAEFTPAFRVGPAEVCCSDACAEARKSGHKRIGKSRRRARMRGVEADAIDPIAVFRRDKWRCHLCGCNTPARLRGTYEPRAPELDHIVALASGGSHTWGNVACACRKCNGAKGARSVGQLGLGLAA